MQKNEWKQTWDKVHSRETTNLIEKDGFEKVIKNKECLDKIVESIFTKLDYRYGKKILEVGAGSGMIIEKLLQNHSVSKDDLYGCDYSESAFNNLRKILWLSHIEKCEANQIGSMYIHEKFDVVFCNSVFHYFSDYKYAEETLLAMKKLIKPKGKICIFDICDINSADEHDYKRMSSRLTGDKPHLYYPLSFFTSYMSHKLQMNCSTFLNNIEDYAYYQKRMNVIYG